MARAGNENKNDNLCYGDVENQETEYVYRYRPPTASVQFQRLASDVTDEHHRDGHCSLLEEEREDLE